MESNAHFVIGVSLRDIEADPLEFLFQQELLSENHIVVSAPWRYLKELGPEKFAEKLGNYYLQENPGEAERVGKAAVVRAIERAIQWSSEKPEEEIQ
jgi:hypothetical protein